jgi:cytoskeletal protein RodZ
MSRRFVLVGLAAAALAILLISYLSLQRRPQQSAQSQDKNRSPEARTEEAQPIEKKEEGATNAEAKSSDQKPAAEQAVADKPEGPKSAAFHPDRAQPVKANSSPQAASIAEALKNKDHPERLSILTRAERYDPAKIDEYLRTAGPSRPFDTAQPARDVPALKAVGTTLFRIKQSGSVKLTVKGAPSGVVSATSVDLGTFQESGLNCATVRADKDGVASVTFVASAGAINDVNILVGSPLASGQVKFVVEIEGK